MKKKAALVALFLACLCVAAPGYDLGRAVNDYAVVMQAYIDAAKRIIALLDTARTQDELDRADAASVKAINEFALRMAVVRRDAAAVDRQQLRSDATIARLSVELTRISHDLAKARRDAGEALVRGRAQPFVAETGDAALADIPGGEVMVGEKRVTVAAFCIGRYEVTRQLWQRVRAWAADHGYEFPGGGREEIESADREALYGDRHPAAKLSWYDAVIWCNAYSVSLGRKPCYYADRARTQVYNGCQKLEELFYDDTADGYRLPTVAEWRRAAGGGLVPATAWAGGDDAAAVAWYADNSGGISHPVGTKRPIVFGLYDLSGNVSEWCFDRYQPEDKAAPARAGEGLPDRIRCGGSFADNLIGIRIDRSAMACSTDRRCDTGLRVVRNGAR